jgi:hydroxymethylpyrimidine pyrophosphatase-like HAD family hydrolase
VIRDDPAKLDDLRKLIKLRFDGSNIEMVKSESDFLEIQAKGCNKGRGIEILRSNYLNSDKKIIFYACGDYENDIPMMKVADVAACPSNASDEVKAVADIVLCECDDGAIAKLIEKL